MTQARRVWELSRAALGDRDGQVVVIKFYMDESGIHEGSPYVTVAAYAGQPKHWKAFTIEWNAKKKPFGIDVYHAADCANQHGEFEGWSKEKCVEFSTAMLPVIAKHLPIGVVIGIDLKAYDIAMAPHPSLRKMVGTPYGCCFQWVVQTILGMIEEYGSNERLVFFHERNDYKQEVMRSFDYVVEQRHHHSSEMTLAFGTKAGYTPLQAADILAYEANKLMRGIDAGRPKRKAWLALDPEERAPEKKALTVRRYGQKNLPNLIARLKTVEEEVRIFGRPVTFLDRPF